MVDQSLRAKFIKRRSYIRPINDEGTIFETDEQAVNRQIEHQEYLWVNAKKEKFKYILQEVEHGSEDDKRNAAARFWEATRLNEHEHAELAELRGLIESHKVSLSGRVKWMAGTSVIKERPASAFNCSATDIAIPADFVDVFWLLLQGCGVGFKPKPGMLTGFGKKVEVVIVGSERTGRGGAEKTTESFDGVTWTIKFGDSAKAWAKGVGKLTTGKYRAQRLVLDLSELRPAGERLRGYGWISSGWEPFAKGLKIITDVLNDKAGEYLDALDIGDIANALGTVLSSRRSAQIWLMEDHAPELEDFITAKNRDHEGQILDGKWWRSQSNNSIAFNKRPPKAVLNKLLRNVLKGGEPGLYNLERARKVAPWAKATNPCAEIILPSKGFCVARNTKVITREGLFNIEERVGKKTEIWNGKRWSSVTPYQTGESVTLFRVYANDGSYLDVTANHRWQVFYKNKSEAWADGIEKEVTTLELIELIGDEKRVVRLPDFTITHDEGVVLPDRYAYTAGVFLGDGCLSTAPGAVMVDLYGDKQNLPLLATVGSTRRTNGNGKEFTRARLHLDAVVAQRLRESLSEVFTWSLQDRLAFLAGLIDTDGSETGTGGVRFYTGNYTRSQEVQLLLRSVGLKGSLNKMAEAGEATNLGTRKTDMWYIQITDARGIPCARVDVSGGHEPVGKGKYQLISSIERLPQEGPSYCLTEPEFGMCVFGNMLTYQCNLVQIVWSRFNGDWDGLMRAHFLMARANYRQTQVNMRDGVLQLQWNDNNQLLRLCGVSPTGIIGSDVKTKEQRRELRAISRYGADSMADELAQNRAALVTQVQPGGTSSKVLGLEGDEVQEGAHVSPTRFLLNNVNFSRHDPLVEKARAANYRVFENPSDPENMLIAMPVAFPASDVYKKVTLSNGEVAEVSTETAIDQLERYLALMEDYVDHNCSITISFDETEIKDIVDWLYKHWDSYIGVSFMHRNDPTKTAQDLGFAYLPQEAISEETYLAYAASLLPIDLSDDAEQDKIGDLDACTAGACPIK